MGDINIFKRFEIKYIINASQKSELLDLMKCRMTTDKYSFSTIRNIYFDTDDYRLIRNSIDKPVYKEKLRVRSYKTVNADEKVFVELKKKYDSVVYKRRISMQETDAMNWLIYGTAQRPATQIANEIEYFCQFYKTLVPAVFLSYYREAYHGIDDADFRMTFDTNILVRRDNMRLIYEPSGTALLDNDKAVLEIKTVSAIPLWLTDFLTKEKLYKTSFSKYGTAYERLILPEQRKELRQIAARLNAKNTKTEVKKNDKHGKYIQWAV